MSACATPSKRRYATRSAAAHAASGLVVVAEGVLMRAYPCPCGWWHLTRRQGAVLASGSPTPTAWVKEHQLAADRDDSGAQDSRGAA
jgi:hypothetical protein